MVLERSHHEQRKPKHLVSTCDLAITFGFPSMLQFVVFFFMVPTSDLFVLRMFGVFPYPIIDASKPLLESGRGIEWTMTRCLACVGCKQSSIDWGNCSTLPFVALARTGGLSIVYPGAHFLYLLGKTGVATRPSGYNSGKTYDGFGLLISGSPCSDLED